MEVNCYACGETLSFEANQTIGRSEECSKCYANVRCCKMCKLYDASAYNECREPSADRIVEKEKSNFCDYYQLGSGGKDNDAKSDALAAANALFKK